MDERGKIIAEYVDGAVERSESKFKGEYIERIEKKHQLAEMHVWISAFKQEKWDGKKRMFVYCYVPVVGITINSITGRARIVLSYDDLRKLINALRRAEYRARKIMKKKDTLVKY